MPSADLIGTAEASEILGLSQRTVKRLALAEVLPFAMKMPGETGAYLFQRDDVLAYQERRLAGLSEMTS